MACFLIPTAEAVITTVVYAVNKKERKSDHKTDNKKNPFIKNLGTLNTMLWGGSALLAFEHVWHGEIVPFPPFLTAAANPTATAEMLHEMFTVGVSMAVLITLFWILFVAVKTHIENRKAAQIKEAVK